MVVTQLGDHRVSRLTISRSDSDFDEFVVGNGRFVLSQQRFGQAGVADNNRRFEIVTATSKVLLLGFIKVHGREV